MLMLLCEFRNESALKKNKKIKIKRKKESVGQMGRHPL